jgi:hypothetical protein
MQIDQTQRKLIGFVNRLVKPTIQTTEYFCLPASINHTMFDKDLDLAIIQPVLSKIVMQSASDTEDSTVVQKVINSTIRLDFIGANSKDNARTFMQRLKTQHATDLMHEYNFGVKQVFETTSIPYLINRKYYDRTQLQCTIVDIVTDVVYVDSFETFTQEILVDE